MKRKRPSLLLLVSLSGVAFALGVQDHIKAQTWSVRTRLSGVIVDPNYPPLCVETDCNCSHFKYQEDAQKLYDDPNFPNDPFGLDGKRGNGSRGIRGKACERLPSRKQPASRQR